MHSSLLRASSVLKYSTQPALVRRAAGAQVMVSEGAAHDGKTGNESGAWVQWTRSVDTAVGTLDCQSVVPNSTYQPCDSADAAVAADHGADW